MFHLKVKKKDQMIHECTLSEGAAVFIGRSQTNDIVLAEPFGISRKHLKIFEEGGRWKVECLSQLGGLKSSTGEVQEIWLQPQDEFYLGEYIFTWKIQAEQTAPKAQTDSGVKALIEEEALKANPEENPEENPELKSEELSEEKLEENPEEKPEEQLEMKSEEPPKEKSELKMNESSTSRASTNTTKVTQIKEELEPYLVISLAEDEEDQSIHLQGQKWTVGRDPSNDICIEETDISRKHFEITKKENQFFIKDLNSSNCTHIGDERLEPGKDYPLPSGSTIRILDIEIYFEVRNPRMKEQMKKHLQDLPAVMPPPSASPPPEMPQGQVGPLHPPSVIADETLLTAPPPSSSNKKKKQFMFIGAALVLIVSLFLFLPEEEKTKEESAEAQIDPNDPLSALSPEEQDKVKNMYVLARQLYHQKKYELCQKTLNDLHEIVPFYEQSASLILNCENGVESLRAKVDIERKNKEMAQIQKMVSETIQKCKAELKLFEAVSDLEECFSPAREADPNNPEIFSIISDFENELDMENQRQIEQAAHRARVKKEISIYKAAQKLKEEGKTLLAIEAYKKFLGRKHPGGVLETVSEAKRELQSMEEALNARLDQALSQCRGLVESKKYKPAHKACQDVTSILPGHSEALKLAEFAVTELNVQIKPIFNASILNESLGRVDLAKKHWAQIIEMDIPGGHYGSKAQYKLDKY